MANKFGNPTDLLGLAVADQIVLRDITGGSRKDPVEYKNEQGIYIPTATKLIRPRTERTAIYDIVDPTAELTIQFAAPVNTNYVITGGTITMRNQAAVELSLTFMQFSAIGKFHTALSTPFDIVIPAGFGVVDILGCTIASGGDALDGSITISTQSNDVSNRTSSDFQDAGYWVYGGKLVKKLTATAAITPPSGALEFTTDKAEPKEGVTTYASQWIEYPTPA